MFKTHLNVLADEQHKERSASKMDQNSEIKLENETKQIKFSWIRTNSHLRVDTQFQKKQNKERWSNIQMLITKHEKLETFKNYIKVIKIKFTEDELFSFNLLCKIWNETWTLDLYKYTMKKKLRIHLPLKSKYVFQIASVAQKSN